MGINDSSLTAPADNGATADVGAVKQDAASLVPPAQPESQLAGGQQPPVKPQEQGFDYDWWKKDSRFGKIWKTDRDVIKSAYESDRILETKYKPAYKQYESIVAKLKKMGYDTEKVDDFFKEHETLKDPNNPVNALGNLLYKWKDDPLVDDIDKFFNDLELKKMQRDYPGMTMQQVNEMRALQTRVKEIEAQKEQELNEKKEVQEKQLIAQIQEETEKQLAEIAKEAGELGIDFTDELRNKLFDMGAKTMMDPSLLPLAFRKLVKDQYDKAYENKLKSKMMEEQEKKKLTTVPVNRNRPDQPTANKSFVDKFAELARSAQKK